MEEAIAEGDWLGAVMETSDYCYYAIKAEVNTLLDCAIAKYRLCARPGNPKDDGKERAAVRAILEEVG